MWRVERRGSSVLLVVIGTRSIECGEWNAGRRVEDSLLSAPLTGLAAGVSPQAVLLEAFAGLEQACGAWADAHPGSAGLPMRVVVSDAWLASTSLPWSPALQRAGFAESLARAQLGEAGFDLAADDVIRLDDAPFGEPRWVLAYPAQLMVALHALAVRMRSPLRSVMPLSSTAWALTRRATRGRALRALAVVDEGALVVAQGRGRMEQVTVRELGYMLDAEHMRDAGRVSDQAASSLVSLRDMWQRMRLRDPALGAVGALAVLQLADAAQPGRIACAIDALPASGPAMTPWRWGAALAALLLAAGASWQAAQAARQADALRSRLEAERPPALEDPSAAIAWTREEKARVQAINAAIRDLNLPLAALLQALQPPRDLGVAVLGVDVQGQPADAGSTIRITAQAPGGVEMARYVAYVAGRKPFGSAYLTRHELEAAQHMHRFTVEATWDH